MGRAWGILASLSKRKTGATASVTSIQFEELKIQGGIEPAPRAPRDRLRRVLNVLVAGIGLVIALPLMVVIAILIKATSRGPVVFRQTRVGVDRRSPGDPPANGRRLQDVGGLPFTIYKFRTMTEGSGEAQAWASPDDPRVTAVGRVLRRYRLDELPQLFNVLKGDMNLVGPRPEQPAIFKQLRTSVDSYTHRQLVLPGITGWAQINQHYDQSEDDVRQKVALDLEYLERRSSYEDLKIMVKTLPVMVFKRGAW